MTVAVTGPGGHVGANLVRALLAQGRKVRILSFEEEQGLEGLDVERVPGDVLDPDSLKRLCDGAEVVFHLAALISLMKRDAARIMAINVDGVRNLVRACLDAKVRRLVHFSSVHAFVQEPMSEAIDEGRALVIGPPEPAYNQSKASGSREVLRGVDEGLDAVILHPSSIVGPHDYKPSIMCDVLRAYYRGKFPAVIEGAYDFVDVRDVVAAALAAEEKGRKGENYLVTGNRVTIRELGQAVSKLSGRRAPTMTTPRWVAELSAPLSEWGGALLGMRPIFTRESLATIYGNSRFSTEKSRRELGHDPRSFEETLRDTVAWYQENGAL